MQGRLASANALAVSASQHYAVPVRCLAEGGSVVFNLDRFELALPPKTYSNGSLDCTNWKTLRAEEVEGQVWTLVGGLLEDPGRLRAGLEELLEERRGARGNPEREELVWMEKIAEADLKRARYQEMAAGELITFDEMREKPASL
jgi:hypothetical protein